MNKIPVQELEAGSKYSKPVYIDDESILVPENVEIREKDIQRLLKWGVEEVRTEGVLMDGSAPSSDDSFEGKGVTSSELKAYRRAIASMDSFFNDCRKGVSLSSSDLEDVIHNFYPLILDKPESAMVLTTLKQDAVDNLSCAAVNCMIYSTVLGIKIKIPGHRLINIAYASLIHDIGMTQIPQNIIRKKGKLNPEELDKVKTHTVYAYRLALKALGLAEEVGRIAMSHHERWDGKGYPRGLDGNKIPVGARILSVADAFVAMSKDRPDRDSLTGYTAIRQILNDNSRRFDPAILKIFIQNIGIYPRGSIVILNNNAIGKIVEIHSAAPLRPVLQLLIDEKGRKPKQKNTYLDLLKEKDIFITRAVDPKEMGKG